MHSMLLVGPYDWDPSVLPKEEFSERLAAFWQRMPGACKGVVIYGDSRAHAELAYLTGFVPKVRHAMALVAREGDPVMLVPGSRAGLISAKRLTWTQNVDLLGDPGKALAQWLDELGAEAAAIALIGGDYMRAPVRQPLLDALGKQALQDATPVLRALMQRKRPRELQAIRGACAMLKAACTALAAAVRDGASITTAMLAAEHAASQRGAQDVRTLFSLDAGRTLIPYSLPLDRVVDPVQAYIAVRNAGYWADGMVSIDPREPRAAVQARAALRTLIAACRPGARARELAQLADEALKPLVRHPLSAPSFGSGIGLALDEAPVLQPGGDETLEPGGVYTVRVGASHDGTHAMASALLAVHEQANEVLWSSLQESSQ